MISRKTIIVALVGLVAAAGAFVGFRGCGMDLERRLRGSDDLYRRMADVKEVALEAKSEITFVDADLTIGKLELSGSGKQQTIATNPAVSRVENAEAVWTPAEENAEQALLGLNLCGFGRTAQFSDERDASRSIRTAYRISMCHDEGKSLNAMRAELRAAVIEKIKDPIVGELKRIYDERQTPPPWTVEFQVSVRNLTTRPFVTVTASVDDNFNPENLSDNPDLAAVLETLIDKSDADFFSLTKKIRYDGYQFTRVADDGAVVLIYLTFD